MTHTNFQKKLEASETAEVVAIAIRLMKDKFNADMVKKNDCNNKDDISASSGCCAIVLSKFLALANNALVSSVTRKGV